MNRCGATINYYDRHSLDFIEQTLSVDMGRLHKQFLHYLPIKARILDAGCGSARDAIAFHKLGHDVEAFDASSAFVELVTPKVNFPVYHCTFEQFTAEQPFDAIWACASLLHVPYSDQVSTLAHLANQLKPNGLIYASYKYQMPDAPNEQERNDRFFCDFNESSFNDIVDKVEALSIIQYSQTSDARPGRENEKWLNIFMRKTANQQNRTTE